MHIACVAYSVNGGIGMTLLPDRNRLKTAQFVIWAHWYGDEAVIVVNEFSNNSIHREGAICEGVSASRLPSKLNFLSDS
jgi:hypothetical protein